MKIALMLILLFTINYSYGEFVYIEGIQTSARYYSTQNFTGRKVKGYTSERLMIEGKTLQALKKVNDELKKDGYELVIYDAFRPQEAVDDFIEWSKTADASTKQYYYPDMEKEDIFKRGFVATVSNHTKGKTVDVTIIKLGKSVCKVKPTKRGRHIFLDDCTVDMGMHYDFFGKESHFQTSLVSATYNARRKYLRDKMKQQGFKGAAGEWWHFTFQDI